MQDVSIHSKVNVPKLKLDNFNAELLWSEVVMTLQTNNF